MAKPSPWLIELLATPVFWPVLLIEAPIDERLKPNVVDGGGAAAPVYWLVLLSGSSTDDKFKPDVVDGGG